MSESRGKPFGWVVLGFIVGVLTTFGTILFLSAGDGGYEDGPSETRTSKFSAKPARPAAASVSAPATSVWWGRKI